MGIISALLKPPQIADEKEPQWELYKEQRQLAIEDERASSDELDKNLITLSSGALGISIAFIKDVVHLPDAVLLWLLITSWILLTLAILSTLISFICSGQALRRHSDFLYKYYIERDDTYLNKQSAWSRGVPACAWIGAGTFIIGVIMTVIFISVNVKKGHTPVSNDSKSKPSARIPAMDARPTPRMIPIAEARSPQPMIPAETRGRMPQSMTAIPRTNAQPASVSMNNKPATETGKK